MNKPIDDIAPPSDRKSFPRDNNECGQHNRLSLDRDNSQSDLHRGSNTWFPAGKSSEGPSISPLMLQWRGLEGEEEEAAAAWPRLLLSLDEPRLFTGKALSSCQCDESEGGQEIRTVIETEKDTTNRCSHIKSVFLQLSGRYSPRASSKRL